MAVKIVMGASACGKAKFIEEHFTDWSYHSVGDIQRAMKKELREQGKLFIDEMSVIVAANEKIKELVVEDLKAGTDVVMAHTLFKAKRRIGYVEAFKEVTDEPIDIYVMLPTDDELRANLKESETCNEQDFEYIKKQIAEIEIPNAVEGFANVYAVTDGIIRELNSRLDPEILTKAMHELMKEEEEMRKAEQKKKQQEMQMDKMEEEGFWHYCEVCGKKEFLTSKAAFSAGWDYPGKHGIYKRMPNYGFGTLAPRTCGECGIMDTLHIKLLAGKIGFEEMEGKNQKIIERIMNEPASLLEEEI